MDAGDLQRGFRLGEWLVEPQNRRITGQDGERPLEPEQMQVLLCLAEHHGEAVDRKTLRQRGWPDARGGDEQLQACLAALRTALGGSPDNHDYIVSAARHGYALIAHLEPMPVAGTAGGMATALIGRLQRLVAELQRRHVLKVAASYLVGMWIVLQVAEVTFQPLHLPGWWLTAITILAVLGLPIVVVLAWSYEITAAGIVLDASDTASIRLPKARRAVAPALVLGVVLMAGVTGFAWWRVIEAPPDEALPPPAPGASSIAVLPLVDMSEAGGIAYLGDGLSEELSTRLAEIPGLRVAARTSAFEFKGQSVDVRKIGQSLGVGNLLEGSVRRQGDSLRVTVQLIDTRTGYHVWARSYDRQWRDVLTVQDEIAKSVTDALKLVLDPQTEQRLKVTAPINLGAYEFYLQGLAELHDAADLSSFSRAKSLFDKAIAIDPALSRAYAGRCQVGVGTYERTHAVADVASAESDCRKALAIDPASEETERALAGLYLTSGRDEQAEAMYRGMLGRTPDNADVHLGLGRALKGQGRAGEAERSFREAIRVEPGYWGGYTALGNFLFSVGRPQEAAAAFRKVAEFRPGSASAFSNLGAALLMQGQLQGATAAFEKSLSLEPSRSNRTNLGTTYYYLGRFREAAQQYELAAAIAAEDHQVIGALGDALWQLQGQREEARAIYRKAIEFAQSSLQVNPTDAVTWAQLAYYFGRVGDLGQSSRSEARATALGPDDMYVQYYCAIAAADRGDTAHAAQAIRRAESLGFPRSLIAAEPGLRSVRVVPKT